MIEWDVKMSDDYKCKQNSIKPITRRVCQNNCSYWKNKRCQLGYNKNKE